MADHWMLIPFKLNLKNPSHRQIAEMLARQENRSEFIRAAILRAGGREPVDKQLAAAVLKLVSLLQTAGYTPTQAESAGGLDPGLLDDLRARVNSGRVRE